MLARRNLGGLALNLLETIYIDALAGCDLDGLASGWLDMIWTGSGGRDLDRLALECLEPIETGFLSTGSIHFGRVRLAGHDLGGLIWTG